MAVVALSERTDGDQACVICDIRHALGCMLFDYWCITLTLPPGNRVQLRASGQSNCKSGVIDPAFFHTPSPDERGAGRTYAVLCGLRV